MRRRKGNFAERNPRETANLREASFPYNLYRGKSRVSKIGVEDAPLEYLDDGWGRGEGLRVHSELRRER